MDFLVDFQALGLSLIAAAFPVTVWYFVLRQKKHSQALGRLLFTFIVAGVGATGFWFLEPVVFEYLQAKDFALMFSLFIVFGVIIEYFRNYVVRITGVGYIKNIDDIIDLSFAAALGFTFFENFFYFYELFIGAIVTTTASGETVPMIELPVTALKYFLLREFFIPPIHIFCTGLFGYFYGIAIFANDDLRKQQAKSLWYRLYATLLFFFPRKYRFKAVTIAQGTCLSALSFGVFFAILQHDPKVSDLLHSLSIPQLPGGIDEQLMPLVAFFFFQAGTIYFFLLMDKKRRWDRLGYLPAKT